MEPVPIPPRRGRQVFTRPGEDEPGRTRRVSKTKRAIPMSDRYRRLLEGEITVDDLDDEEILRGQLRDSTGSFRGKAPQVVPHTMHAALRSAMETRAQRRLAASMPEVLDNLVRTATSRHGAAEARVKAAQLIMERVFGKVPDKIDQTMTVTARWEEAAVAGRLFVDIDATPVPPELAADQQEVIQDVVDAEIVDDRTELEVALEVEPERPRARPRQKTPTGIKL